MATTEETSRKIKALLDKARNPETGEAEARTFLAKAAELMARHGLDEDDLAGGDDAGVLLLDAEKLWTGPYGDIRMAALGQLGKSLGVYVIGRFNPHSDDPTHIDIIGQNTLITRTLDIWMLLQTQADAFAMGAMPRPRYRRVRSLQVVERPATQWMEAIRVMDWVYVDEEIPPTDEEIDRTRRSAFYGFITGCCNDIDQLLKEPEAAEAEATLHPVLASEFDKAKTKFEDLLRDAGVDPEGIQAQQVDLDPEAANRGFRAATRADLGIHNKLQERSEDHQPDSLPEGSP